MPPSFFSKENVKESVMQKDGGTEDMKPVDNVWTTDKAVNKLHIKPWWFWNDLSF